MRKTKAFIFLIILIAFSLYIAGCKTSPYQPPPSQSFIKTIPAQVIYIVDGDTIHVYLKNGKKEKVRFIGIDTPESTKKVEPYGKKAAAYTKKHLKGKTVYLEFDIGERDKYGRLLSYIWLEPPDNDSETEVRAKMFNANLVLIGYAKTMTVPPNIKYADLFVKFQREAQKKKKGLWGRP